MKYSKSIRLSLIIISIFLAAMTVMAQTKGDSDGDGIPDADDQCPNQAGPANNNGCPVSTIIIIPTDSDGDGVPDADDQCPNQAGSANNNGCPALVIVVPDNNKSSNDSGGSAPQNLAPTINDSDGDGVPDENDECPAEFGLSEFNGCPPPSGEADAPLFQLPPLPVDGCYVTPSSGSKSRVRIAPDVESEHIGNLLSGIVYPAQGFVGNKGEQWIKLAANFEHLDFEMWGGLSGYVSASVVVASDGCTTLVGGLDDDFGFVFPAHGTFSDPVCYTGTTPGGLRYIQACSCDSDDGDCLAKLIAACPDGVGELDPGPETTACWYEDDGDSIDLPDGFIPVFPGSDNEPIDINFGRPENETRADPVCYSGTTPGGLRYIQACSCDSNDGDCLAKLIAACPDGVGELDPGPETTACWYEDEEDTRPGSDVIVMSTPDPEIEIGNLSTAKDDPGVLEGEPECNEELDVCSCSLNDAACIVQLVASCQAEGDHLLNDGESTSCYHNRPNEDDSGSSND